MIRWEEEKILSRHLLAIKVPEGSYGMTPLEGEVTLLPPPSGHP